MQISSTTKTFLIFFILLTACRVNEQAVIGRYQLKNFPKSTLTIEEGGTFEVVKINPNPYLHPFEHPDQYYFKTRGTWNLVGNIIELRGTSDSITYPISEIIERTEISDTTSTFEFQDDHGDPVSILFVQYPDSLIVAKMHEPIGPIYTDLHNEYDTLSFFFYGYRPWKYVKSKELKEHIKIKLTPEFRPDYFDNLNLKAKPYSIGSGKGKFLRNKSM